MGCSPPFPASPAEPNIAHETRLADRYDLRADLDSGNHVEGSAELENITPASRTHPHVLHVR